MTQWLIVPPAKIAQLEALNDARTDRKCTVIDTIDGVHLTGGDKLGDAYWADYQTFLEELEVFVGTPVWPPIIDDSK